MAVLAGSPSLYGSDTLTALAGEAQSVTGHRLGESDLGDIALRLMADHARTMTFLVADGVILQRGPRLRAAPHHPPGHPLRLPAGRRAAGAAGHGRAHHRPDGRRLPRDRRGPRPGAAHHRAEEESFRRTLASGSQILDTQLDRLEPGARCRARWRSSCTTPTASLRGHPGDGRPAGLRRRRGRLRGRDGRAAPGPGPPARARASPPATRSTSSSSCWPSTGPRVHREATSTRPGHVIGIVGDGLYLDRTPFYAESGGQVGDTGTITTDTGIVDVVGTTYGLPGLHRHTVTVREGTVEVGQRADARIDGGAATPSAATTPAPTSCTGRCARCWASTCAAGLARGPRPPALRLQPLRAGERRPDPPDRGPGQPRDPRQRPCATSRPP